MLNKQQKKIFLIIILYTNLFAEIDIQENIYNAAEELIRFDEKMTQAIIKHNQIDAKDADEMRLESMMNNDFTETPSGYLLERTIKNHTETEVNVEVKERVLIISTKTFDKVFFSHELNNTKTTTMSSMSVSLFLPHDADENKMQEKYENGLLTITFSRKTTNNH